LLFLANSLPVLSPVLKIKGFNLNCLLLMRIISGIVGIISSIQEGKSTILILVQIIVRKREHLRCWTPARSIFSDFFSLRHSLFL
jgi:hypothetical protein